MEYTTGCGRHDLSVSPNPLGTKLGFELGWGSASEVWALRVWGQGLTVLKPFILTLCIIVSTFPNKVPVKVLEELHECLVCHDARDELVLCQASAPVLIQGIKQLPRPLS